MQTLKPACSHSHPFPFLILCLLLGANSSTIFAAELSLKGYQRADGAITVHMHGDLVDPYFASKALIAAHQASLDIQQSSKAWIEWAITHQLSNGLFERICINESGYSSCATADADDAMLALWIELLIITSPKEGMPRHWQQSMQRAYQYLTTLLYDRNNKIFWISSSNRVGLLMDNIEVYSAFKTLSSYYSTLGDSGRAAFISQSAERLHEAILNQFWQPPTNTFRASMQERAHHDFYPDQAAQILPLLTDFKIPSIERREHYRNWMAKYKDDWFRQASIDYPWGLIALVAANLEDWNTSSCWISHAEPFRNGKQWNVLEEAIFQGLLANPSTQNILTNKHECTIQ